ncbi:MAG: hypothetical protein AB7V56_06380 [Candidatus Nitrosocosmicus sp.]
MFGVGREFDKLKENNGTTLFKYIYEGRTTIENAEQFFFPIYGLRDIKESLYRTFIVPKQVNTLLSGPSSSTKDMFLLKIYDQCNDVIYYEPALEKRIKLVDEIYKNQKAKVIIIDNINKLKKSDLDILPRLLNTGIIEKIIRNNKIEIKMENIKIFAALNEDQNRLDIDESIRKLKTLFVDYYVPEYSDEEFIKSVKFYCRNKLPNEKIEIMANELVKLDIKDIREVIFISKVLRETDTKEDIVRIINARVKCMPSKDADM